MEQAAEYTSRAVAGMAEDPARWTDYMLGVHCGITLARIKAGSLLCVPRKELGGICRRLGEFSRKGIRFAPLRLCGGRTGVLVYAESMLHKVLSRRDVKEFLCGCGYEYERIDEAIATLRMRIMQNREFPHEIGLFLGYPPEDVRGFMENRQVKMVGYWRVYSDEEGARKIFRRYDKCGKCICKRLIQGESLCEIFNIKEAELCK